MSDNSSNVRDILDAAVAVEPPRVLGQKRETTEEIFAEVVELARNGVINFTVTLAPHNIADFEPRAKVVQLDFSVPLRLTQPIKVHRQLKVSPGELARLQLTPTCGFNVGIKAVAALAGEEYPRSLHGHAQPVACSNVNRLSYIKVPVRFDTPRLKEVIEVHVFLRRGVPRSFLFTIDPEKHWKLFGEMMINARAVAFSIEHERNTARWQVAKRQRAEPLLARGSRRNKALESVEEELAAVESSTAAATMAVEESE